MRSTSSGSNNGVDTPLNITADNKNRIFASPLAKRIAEEAGIELKRITGSGPYGRIIKGDVEAIVKNGEIDADNTPKQNESNVVSALPAKVSTGGSYTEIPNSNTRKIIANPSRIKEDLNWSTEVDFEDFIRICINSRLDSL